VGALMALLEKRKAMLTAEGLFDSARKKPLPYLPKIIGMVTSPTGAVIRDMLHRIKERFPCHVLLWPVLVQGDQAIGQISAAIEGFNRLEEKLRPELIIIARGGGSLEDLWAFNEEMVVRAIAASTIPVISAIGHETDTTLADYAADCRAPTPTAAAEIALPVRTQLVANVTGLHHRMLRATTRLLEIRYTFMGQLRLWPSLKRMVQEKTQRLDLAALRLGNVLPTLWQRKQEKIRLLQSRLRPPTERLYHLRARLTERDRQLQQAFLLSLEARQNTLWLYTRIMESCHYDHVLKRGFALVRRIESGALIASAREIQGGDTVRICFGDGTKDATIIAQE